MVQLLFITEYDMAYSHKPYSAWWGRIIISSSFRHQCDLSGRDCLLHWKTLFFCLLPYLASCQHPQNFSNKLSNHKIVLWKSIQIFRCYGLHHVISHSSLEAQNNCVQFHRLIKWAFIMTRITCAKSYVTFSSEYPDCAVS